MRPVTATLRFLGTRGEIDIRSRRHRRHSATLIDCAGVSILIDRGTDWLRLPASVRPDAIVLTHAHADHAGGLARGADCPVFATRETLALLGRFPLVDRRLVEPRKPFRFGDLRFEAFAVEHSLLAPAVGYRVSTRRCSLFYCPDVALIHGRREALRGVSRYIGDGATLSRSMVRNVGCRLIGHASIRDQVDWCAEEDVRCAIFTHCGSGIVRSDGRRVAALVRRLGDERSVEARIAFDGLLLSLPERTAAVHFDIHQGVRSI